TFILDSVVAVSTFRVQSSECIQSGSPCSPRNSALCTPYPSGGAPVGHLATRGYFLEDDLQGHVQDEVLRRVLDADDVGHHADALFELDDGDGVGLWAEAGRRAVVDHVGVELALASGLEPLDVLREAVGAEEAGVEVGLAAGVAALDPELVLVG